MTTQCDNTTTHLMVETSQTESHKILLNFIINTARAQAKEGKEEEKSAFLHTRFVCCFTILLDK
ncbi:CLUMA_CG010150, isoform A [Clunio marinus]|uniref:CLUMA_CG010150, isoform A n=1 Tax=Clunio marinus TaxID=568069 RepID=A0A1J1I8L3_9DIPT|nr:CLUMA_CG010150, isoform A [Clunio marinus]